MEIFSLFKTIWLARGHRSLVVRVWERQAISVIPSHCKICHLCPQLCVDAGAGSSNNNHKTLIKLKYHMIGITFLNKPALAIFPSIPHSNSNNCCSVQSELLPHSNPPHRWSDLWIRILQKRNYSSSSLFSDVITFFIINRRTMIIKHCGRKYLSQQPTHIIQQPTFVDLVSIW